MRIPVSIVALLALAGAAPAAAFTCTVTPKGDAVTVKIDNPYAKPTTCTVTCRFTVPRRHGDRELHASYPRRRQGLVRLRAPDRRQGLRLRRRRRELQEAVGGITRRGRCQDSGFAGASAVRAAA